MGKLQGRQILQTELSLDLQVQEELRLTWNERLASDLAFAPEEEKLSGVTAEKVKAENLLLGEFAVNYLRNTLERNTSQSDKLRRLEQRKKILSVGYGKSFDSNWVDASVKAFLETWWVDVSDVACQNAVRDLGQQFKELPPPGVDMPFPPPKVVQGEIRSILADPESAKLYGGAPALLDISTIETWYMCRTLGCLDDESAHLVLWLIGQASFSEEADPNGSNFFILVNALADYNEERVTKTSALRTIQMIEENLSLGAGRKVEVTFEASHRYFQKIVTAMTLRAK